MPRVFGRERFYPTTGIERTRTPVGIGIEQQIYGSRSSLSGCTDKRPEKQIAQYVDDRIVHFYDIGRHDARIGGIHGNTPVFYPIGQFKSKQCKSEFGIAVYGYTPKTAFAFLG